MSYNKNTYIERDKQADGKETETDTNRQVDYIYMKRKYEILLIYRSQEILHTTDYTLPSYSLLQDICACV